LLQQPRLHEDAKHQIAVAPDARISQPFEKTAIGVSTNRDMTNAAVEKHQHDRNQAEKKRPGITRRKETVGSHLLAFCW